MSRTDTNLGVRCPPDLFARLETAVRLRKTTRTALVNKLIADDLAGTPGGRVIPEELAKARNVVVESLHDGRDPVRDVICAAAIGPWKSPLAELIQCAFAGLDYQSLVDAKVKELALECRPKSTNQGPDVQSDEGNPADSFPRIRSPETPE